MDVHVVQGARRRGRRGRGSSRRLRAHCNPGVRHRAGPARAGDGAPVRALLRVELEGGARLGLSIAREFAPEPVNLFPTDRRIFLCNNLG